MASDTGSYRISAEARQTLLDGVATLLRDQVVLKQGLREQQQQADATAESLYLEILEVVDGLEALQAFAEANPEPSPAFMKRLPRNLGSLTRKLLGILAAKGVEPLAIEAGPGEPDYAACRVVERQEGAPGDGVEVVQVVRSGYRFGEQILRPAEVVLAVPSP